MTHFGSHLSFFITREGSGPLGTMASSRLYRPLANMEGYNPGFGPGFGRGQAGVTMEQMCMFTSYRRHRPTSEFETRSLEPASPHHQEEESR